MDCGWVLPAAGDEWMVFCDGGMAVLVKITTIWRRLTHVHARLPVEILLLSLFLLHTGMGTFGVWFVGDRRRGAEGLVDRQHVKNVLGGGWGSTLGTNILCPHL
jgi:hypothetical protein